MRPVTLDRLCLALQASWPADAKGREWQDWPSDNPARGQCIPSSLVVQDYFRGDIVRNRVTGKGINETHYFNVLEDGTIIDTTRSQYKNGVIMRPEPINLAKNRYSTVRERCLADEETYERYIILKSRVVKLLAGM